MGLQTKAHSRNIPTYQSADILPGYKAAAGRVGLAVGMPHLWRCRMTDRILKNLEFLRYTLDIAKYLLLIKIFYNLTIPAV